MLTRNKIATFFPFRFTAWRSCYRHTNADSSLFCQVAYATLPQWNRGLWPAHIAKSRHNLLRTLVWYYLAHVMQWSCDHVLTNIASESWLLNLVCRSDCEITCCDTKAKWLFWYTEPRWKFRRCLHRVHRQNTESSLLRSDNGWRRMDGLYHSI